jgi:Rho termination factor, RNA-binding domain
MSDNDFPNQPAGNGRAHKSHEEDGSPRPVTGILDIVDNRAFVRTEGYLPGPRDAPVPLELTRKLQSGTGRGWTRRSAAEPGWGGAVVLGQVVVGWVVRRLGWGRSGR